MQIIRSKNRGKKMDHYAKAFLTTDMLAMSAYITLAVNHGGRLLCAETKLLPSDGVTRETWMRVAVEIPEAASDSFKMMTADHRSK